MGNINIKVNVKGITKAKSQVQAMDMVCDDTISDVEGMLKYVVAYYVTQYNTRLDQGDILYILSGAQIKDKEITGKIGFGVNYGSRKADLATSIKNALQSFEDGIVVLFVNGDRKEKLSDELVLSEVTELTFVKLTMLSGRMW